MSAQWSSNGRRGQRTHTVASTGVIYVPLNRLARSPFKCGTFVHRDVIGLVTLDFVLRLFRTRVHSVALKLDWRGYDLDDPAANVSRLRVPADMIPELEASRSHRLLSNALRRWDERL